MTVPAGMWTSSPGIRGVVTTTSSVVGDARTTAWTVSRAVGGPRSDVDPDLEEPAAPAWLSRGPPVDQRRPTPEVVKYNDALLGVQEIGCGTADRSERGGLRRKPVEQVVRVGHCSAD